VLQHRLRGGRVRSTGERLGAVIARPQRGRVGVDPENELRLALADAGGERVGE